MQFPYWHEQKGIWKNLADVDLTKDNLGKFTRSQTLDEYKTVDGLIVKMEATYVVALEQFQYWQFAHPAKKFYLSVSLPKDFSIQVKPLVLHPDLAQTKIAEGFAMVQYDTWMLPFSGVAFRFIKK